MFFIRIAKTLIKLGGYLSLHWAHVILLVLSCCDSICIFFTGECVCTASGDPHYSTFDGGRINYQGICKYTLVNSTFDGCGMVVNAKNQPHWKNNKVSTTKYIEVQMLPSGNIIRLDQGGEVFVSLKCTPG